MLLTSQNRFAVNQANSANVAGQALAAVVVHQPSPAMRPYTGMRRTRRGMGLLPTFPKSKRRLTDAGRQLPECRATEMSLSPRLWASLVLSKTARG